MYIKYIQEYIHPMQSLYKQTKKRPPKSQMPLTGVLPARSPVTRNLYKVQKPILGVETPKKLCWQIPGLLPRREAPLTLVGRVPCSQELSHISVPPQFRSLVFPPSNQPETHFDMNRREEKICQKLLIFESLRSGLLFLYKCRLRCQGS